MTKIGVQAMMLKTQFAEDGAFATLKRLSDIGFHAVELSQVSMAKDDVAEIDRARSELGDGDRRAVGHSGETRGKAG